MTVAEETGEVAGVRYAGFWHRALVVVIDAGILALVSLALTPLDGAVEFWASLGVGVVYVVAGEGSRWGQTPGKWLTGMRVVSARDGGRLGYPRAAVRYVGRFLSMVVVFVGYLWMVSQPRRQTWHDLLAGSIVIRQDLPAATRSIGGRTPSRPHAQVERPAFVMDEYYLRPRLRDRLRRPSRPSKDPDDYR